MSIDIDLPFLKHDFIIEGALLYLFSTMSSCMSKMKPVTTLVYSFLSVVNSILNPFLVSSLNKSGRNKNLPLLYIWLLNLDSANLQLAN